jgi:glycosyltransferase involved in cell wall biosynthesis
MPAHLPLWELAGFSDLNFLFNPVGDWWFDTPWTGAAKNAVMILSGKDQWRRPQHHGLDIFEALQARFPGKLHLHDGHVAYKTSRQMSYMLSGARVFLALDEPYGQGERPLSLAFSEALAAGCPVVARDLPGLNYKDFITTNGVATNDFESMCAFIERCLGDYDYASRCSGESRRIAHEHFSTERLQVKYLEVFDRARQAWLRTNLRPQRPVALSAYARHYKE